MQIMLAAVFILLLCNISGQVNDNLEQWVLTPFDDAFTNRRITIFVLKLHSLDCQAIVFLPLHAASWKVSPRNIPSFSKHLVDVQYSHGK